MTLEEALKVTTIRADELDRVNVKALREIYENDKANKYSFAFEADRKRHGHLCWLRW